MNMQWQNVGDYGVSAIEVYDTIHISLTKLKIFKNEMRDSKEIRRHWQKWLSICVSKILFNSAQFCKNI